ncbi:hypothetical protein [Sediminibacillus massiliensis]|uniref:hypothetical protein n=1 Tax=Sediminibacillus massiliensis TaxID=1926277 RepID=UPI00098853B9|nr:hypothetical protein [Sediminibacillus massiliensis]
MSKSSVALICVIIGCLALGWAVYEKQDVSVIKYFPPDESQSFSSFSTEINMLSQTDLDEYDIQVISDSTMEAPIYLRQDVSLLYVDGRLKGILSKWKENAQSISQESTIHGEDSSHFQAITLHHGEVHYPDDKIKSIQAMSYDELYVIDSPYSPLESFSKPVNPTQVEWKKTLDHATNQQLSYFWRQLIADYKIPSNSYTIVPLTELYQFQSTPLPNLTQEKTNQVIGQLWEGLYKNYILGVSQSQTETNPLNTFIPIILFDNNGKHLIVLYRDNRGKNQQLIQYYSTEPN